MRFALVVLVPTGALLILLSIVVDMTPQKTSLSMTPQKTSLSTVMVPEVAVRQQIVPMTNIVAHEEVVSALPPVVTISGANTFYERVYYRANSSRCEREGHRHHGRREPLLLYDNGFSAGPIIQCSSKDMSKCDPEQSLMNLDAMKDLAAKRAFQFSLPNQSKKAHNARILDRPRMSSSTGIVFLDEKHFVAASFGNRKLYLYEYNVSDAHQMHASLLDSVDTVGFTDLVDYDPQRGVLASSQFFRGTQELHKVDLVRGQLSKYKEVDALHGLHQWCHESAFYPSETATVIAATANRHQNSQSLMMRLFDYEAQRVVAQFLMNATSATRGFHMKSLRFIDSHHFVATLTAFAVAAYRDKCPQDEYDYPDKDKPFGRVVLFRMNFSVEDIASARRAPAVSSEFTVLDFYEVGLSALDGVAYKDGRAIVADQLNDKVLVFSVDVDAEDPLRLVSEHTGYVMPHGVAFSRTQDHFAVTCYGDNSVFVHRVALEVPAQRSHAR